MRAKASWGYDAGFLARCRPSLTVSAAAIATRPHAVALQTGAPVGFYALGLEDGTLALDSLFVEPDRLGRGIGRALWRHALAAGRALGHATMRVVADPNAAGFYRRMGAVAVGGEGSDFAPGRVLPVFRAQLTAR
ncbi:MAG: GNAT family N-acetyltransferase [Dongiaceae bacterium]